ncbi:Hypothetical predicted protein [Mytilus galloprovincialis]|uniref:Apple domain-containing protein n=1 Tax=Mytilus galloprovincialis TaxID=29158 RepID=A0A8B6BHH5_MYTGA|nr:Hypothetical predicted protein [Mytilus galloprovincialis]
MICESLYIIILFGFIESYSTFRQLSGIYQNSFDDKYQDVNAVSIQTVGSLLDCVARCGKEQRCLRIFHNRITQICILHSDPFTYTATKTGEGWRSYLTKDEYGLCPNSFFYYRQLQMCYNFNPPMSANKLDFLGACNYSNQELLRINSEERQSYVEMVSANIGSVYATGICIQGTNTIDVNNAWTFDDGTPMTFFKWLPSEPIGQGWIRINRGSDFGWGVPPRPNWWTCTYMCEIRII